MSIVIIIILMCMYARTCVHKLLYVNVCVCVCVCACVYVIVCMYIYESVRARPSCFLCFYNPTIIPNVGEWDGELREAGWKHG